jgi:RING-like zinc finger
MLDNPNTSKGSVVTMRRTNTGLTRSSSSSSSSSSSFGAIRRRSTSLMLSSTSPTSKQRPLVTTIIIPPQSSRSTIKSLTFETKHKELQGSSLHTSSNQQLKSMDFQLQKEVIQSLLLSSASISFDVNTNTKLSSSNTAATAAAIRINKSSSSFSRLNGTNKSVTEIAASIPTLYPHSDILLQVQKDDLQNQHQQHDEISSSSSSSSSCAYQNKYSTNYYYYSLNVKSKRLNKSNPYIGSFRHSPPTTYRDVLFQLSSLDTGSTGINHRLFNTTNTCTGTAHHNSHPSTCTSSPLRPRCHSISFDSLQSIRTAGSSSSSTTNDFSVSNNYNINDSMLSLLQLDLNSLLSTAAAASSNNHNINKSLPTSKKNEHNRALFHRPNVSGRLRGGSPIIMSNNNKSNSSSSLAVNLLSGVASWLLHLDNTIPYISDEHTVRPLPSSNSTAGTIAHPQPVTTDSSDCEDSSSSPVNDDTVHDNDDDDSSSCSNSTVSDHDDDGTCSSTNNDTNSTTSSYDNYDTAHGSRIVPPDVAALRAYNSNRTNSIIPQLFGLSSVTTESCVTATAMFPPPQLDMSALSLQSDNVIDTGSLSMSTLLFDTANTTSTSNSNTNTVGNTRTDYETITQMDILRMARAASRHLDVDSIFQLPIITYNTKPRSLTTVTTTTSIKEEENDQKEVEERRQGTSSSFKNGKRKSKLSSTKGAAVNAAAAVAVEFSWMMVDTEPSDESSCSVGSSLVPGSSSDSSTKNNGGRFKIITTRTPSSDEEEEDDDSFVVATKDNDSRNTTNTNTEDPNNATSNEANNNNTNKNEEDDICVICFEQFNNGDRLRVLPCSHSFHVGCIDKWLCGSHSFQDCYTAGCPTCKKHPQVHFTTGTTNNSNCLPTTRTTTATGMNNYYNIEGNYHQQHYAPTSLYDSIDGSAPSWSFTRIGSALMREN